MENHLKGVKQENQIEFYQKLHILETNKEVSYSDKAVDTRTGLLVSYYNGVYYTA